MTNAIPISEVQARHFRMLRSGLITPFASVQEAATALVGVQAQILSAAGLALANRTQGLTNDAFERILYQERTLVKLWGQRGTLHLYTAQDWPLIIGARAVNMTWWERQLAREGVIAANRNAADAADAANQVHPDAGESAPDADAFDYYTAVSKILAAMGASDTFGRSDLRALNLNLPEEFYSSWGGIFHNLLRAGFICHAQRMGNEGRFAHRARWLPDLGWNPPAPADANLELARRYFATYGPATFDDFQYWRHAPGDTGRTVRQTLTPLLQEVQVGEQAMWMLPEDVDMIQALPTDADAMPVRMLYRFEPLLLGHRDRTWLVDAAFANHISRPAGHIEGVVLQRGRAVATWRYDRKGAGLLITVLPFRKLPKAVQRQLPRLATEVASFFALPLVDLIVQPPSTEPPPMQPRSPNARPMSF